MYLCLYPFDKLCYVALRYATLRCVDNENTHHHHLLTKLQRGLGIKLLGQNIGDVVSYLYKLFGYYLKD